MQRAFFERFTENTCSPCEMSEYIASILREVGRILTSRQQVQSFGVELSGLPEFYGVPDLLGRLNLADQVSWPTIAREFSRLVMYYEPRIKDVNFLITEFESQSQTLVMSCQAMIFHVNGWQNLNFDFKFLLKENAVYFL